MDFKIVTELLLQITVMFKWPVVLMLFFALVWLFFEIGGFFRELWERKVVLNKSREWYDFEILLSKKRIQRESLLKDFFSVKQYPSLVSIYREHIEDRLDNYNYQLKLINEIEISANRNLYLLQMGVKLGPMLGLMGTLIPLGPALKGISTSDLEIMTDNLIVVFSTTVLGLFIGAVSYILLVIKQHWYSRDLSDIDFIHNQLNDSGVYKNDQE